MIPPQYIQTEADKQAIDEGCHWDQSKGDRVVKFFEDYLTLSHSNQPFKLMDFQKDFIYRLFCWRRKDGRRRFTKCLLTSGKKSFGKSTLSAGLALYFLLADGVDSPLVVQGAATREQASEIYRETLFSCQSNEKLSSVLKLVESQKQIKYPKNNGVLKAISSESSGKGGWNCSVVILDECALHPDSKLYDMLKGSMVARREPMFMLLSNAGYDKAHYYYDIYKHAKSILDGKCLDTDFLPIIHEVEEGENWKDESVWPRACPGLGSLTTLDNLREVYKESERSTQGEMYWRRFFCNQWTEKKDAWLNLDRWDECKGELPSLEGVPCFVGVDLSATNDLTSIVACYPIEAKFYVKCWNFATRNSMEKRSKQNLKDYQEFSYGKSLTIVEGNAIDYEQIRSCIRAIRGDVKMIVFDKWSSLETSQLLAKEGFNILTFPQVHSFFNEPTKKVEQLVNDGKIVHDGNACLRWCINNVTLDQNQQGLVKPSKSNEFAKIDAAVCLIMAISQAVLPFEAIEFKSAYDTEELFVF